MFDKTKVFNLALAALFLQKRISNADTDASTEALSLNTFWDISYYSALQEMDLDSTSQTKTLALIDTLSLNDGGFWQYVYEYPSDCLLLRRIVSQYLTDDRETAIDHRVEIRNGVKVIMCNESLAKIEYISKDIPIGTLHAEAIMFIALKLAMNCIPLVVGTNSATVAKSLNDKYDVSLVNAQKKDSAESSVYKEDWSRSGFVKARLS